MAIPCFLNQVTAGPGNQNFLINAGACVVTSGTYGSMVEFRNDFLVQAQTVLPNLRMGLSSTGHLTIDHNGGANFDITFTDLVLGYMLGWTPSGGGPHLTGAQTYTAPRRIAGSLYLEHGGGPTAATIGEHNVLPGLMHVTQTDSLSGVRRTTRTGVSRDRTSFGIQYLDNTARFVSPAAASAVTYANAGVATFDVGLTQYEHAKVRWWDSTGVAYQGWSDGRPVRFFEDSADTTFAISSLACVVIATDYTTWVFDEQVCKDFPGVKARPPLTTKYHLTLPAVEYLTP